MTKKRDAEKMYADAIRDALAALGDDKPIDDEEMARRLQRAQDKIQAAMRALIQRHEPEHEPEHEHEHRYSVTDIQHAPINDVGGHTSFHLLTCRCGEVKPFPRFNFDLTTPAFQRDLIARLAVEGCVLVLEGEQNAAPDTEPKP